MKVTEIILPKRIAVLREQPNQDIKVKNEEFNLYYENFIHPIYPWQDIVVECKYGKNYKHCWKITEYPADVSEFELVIKVFNEEGKLDACGKTMIELYDQDIDKPFKILCVGDSMTHHMIYPAHMQNRLKNVFTCGTRSYDGHVFGEGRGGWKYDEYFNNHSLKEGERGPLKWVSPFLFPKGISGKEYFGDMEYYIASQEENRSTCCFNGFEFNPFGTIHYSISVSNDEWTHPDKKKDYFEVQSYVDEEKWIIQFFIPFEFTDEIFHCHTKRMKGNLYKNGFDTVKRHYISYYPIYSEEPAFHSPQFFGDFILE